MRQQERQMDNMESELRDVKKDLEKKETRLKQRTRSVEELMEKIERERKSFDIALQGEHVYFKLGSECVNSY